MMMMSDDDDVTIIFCLQLSLSSERRKWEVQLKPKKVKQCRSHAQLWVIRCLSSGN